MTVVISIAVFYLVIATIKNWRTNKALRRDYDSIRWFVWYQQECRRLGKEQGIFLLARPDYPNLDAKVTDEGQVTA